jgi:class 3 adenylate cyclase/tetratricopeptide (TPR) repeat protein
LGTSSLRGEAKVATCSSCATELTDGARFCAACGASVGAPLCSSCGEAPTPGARFCASCGTPVVGVASVVAPLGPPGTPVAERRVTSVLFADLVGFTPLSESRDAEDVRELLTRYFEECRKVIGRYGGSVEKFIGDAVMAVWGVPVAHEDDAERAVRAGLELVVTVTAMGDDVGAPGLAMRVGVVTGEVAVTLGATAEGMVAGDAVNTAARVQSAAEPGQVWVDDATRSLTIAAITFEDTGEHELKGKAAPLRLWRAGSVVADVGGGQRVDGLEAPLTGRDRELRLIKELFHATEEAGRPKLVVLDGEAGIGKSRLAWEFEKYVDGLATTTRWHRGRCLSYGDGVAFWALAEAIRARLGLVEADTGEVVIDHLEQALIEFVTDAGERDWLRPRLAVLLGVGAGAAFPREDLFAAWTAFLERIAQDAAAVVLVVDDAQYADDGLLDFLDHLLATARAPIFVLALARPELLAQRPDLGGRRVSAIRLEPLDDAAMARMIDGLVVGLPASVRDALVARADGVPLFAVETVRALIDRDLVIPKDGRYVSVAGIETGLDAIGAPASLQALIAARLDALSPDERRIVTDASVLGQAFTLDGLAALVPDEVNLEDHLAALRRKEFFTFETDRFSGERGQYRFVQAVVRQVAYATQSKRDRKTRHLIAAEYLRVQPDPGDDLAVVIAQHLLDAVDASPDSDPEGPERVARACELLERAAHRARALGSPSEGLRLAEAARARTKIPTDRARLLLLGADSAVDVGDYQVAIELATAATELYDDLGDSIGAGLAAATHALALCGGADQGGAIAIAQPRWQGLDGVPGGETAMLQLGRTLSLAHQRLGEWHEAGRYAERRILLAEAADDPAALSAALNSVGIRYVMIGAPITGKAQIQLAAEIARAHDFTEALAFSLTSLAALQVSRDLPAALAHGQEGMEVAQRSGAQDPIDSAATNYLVALWTAGRLAEATALCVRVRENLVDAVSRVALTTIESWLADAFGTQLPVPPDSAVGDDELALAWQGNLEVMLELHGGVSARAAIAAERSLPHLLAACGIEDDFMHLWPPLVLAALAARDTQLAERMLLPVLGAGRGTVSPAVAAHLHRLQGLLGAARGDAPAYVEAELRAGIACLVDFGAVGFAAQAEQELGLWLISQNREEEAAPWLERARTTYADIGATGWIARLDAQLVRTTEPAQ